MLRAQSSNLGIGLTHVMTEGVYASFLAALIYMLRINRTLKQLVTTYDG